MKQDNINYFMVGTLVLSALVVLIFVLLRLAGQNGDTDSYYVSYINITGIKQGSAVTHGGYQIGQVESITPRHHQGNTHYRLELSVRRGWQIPEQSVARIVSPGLLSDPLIDILAGNSNNYLSPGSSIEGKEASNIFTALDSVAYEIQDLSENSIRPLIENLNNSVGNISGRLDSIGHSLDDTVGEGLPRIINKTEVLLASLNNSATRINALFNDDNQQHMAAFVKNADLMSQNLLRVSSGFNRNIEQLEKLLSSSTQLFDENSQDIRQSVISLRNALTVVLENIDTIVYNINTTSRNMNEFSHQLRTNPSVLLGSQPPRDKLEGQP